MPFMFNRAADFPPSMLLLEDSHSNIECQNAKTCSMMKFASLAVSYTFAQKCIFKKADGEYDAFYSLQDI